jgi:hypothetical protein
MTDSTQTQQPTKRCPYCAEVILADAVKCKHCGEWLDRSAMPTTPAEVARSAYSKCQEPEQLFSLCLFSFFLYEIYWYYRNWKHVKEYRGLDISPFWRTVGGLVPVVSLFLDFSLFTHIHDLGKNEKAETYKSPGLLVFFSAIFSAVYWTLFFIEQTSSIGPVIFLVRVCEIAVAIAYLIIPVTVQNGLNAIWKKKEPNLPVRERLTDGEIAVMIAGIVLWIFWFIGTLVKLAVPSF